MDKHKLSQLIAFALIRDRTTQAFAAFFARLKWHLCGSDTDMDSDPTAAAFVVDRHDGQLAALRLVFSKSRIVFGSKRSGIWYREKSPSTHSCRF
jgi:hypothetical protein